MWLAVTCLWDRKIFKKGGVVDANNQPINS